MAFPAAASASLTCIPGRFLEQRRAAAAGSQGTAQTWADAPAAAATVPLAFSVPSPGPVPQCFHDCNLLEHFVVSGDHPSHHSSVSKFSWLLFQVNTPRSQNTYIGMTLSLVI